MKEYRITNTEVSVSEEVSIFGMKVGMIGAALIGIWGLSCLIGGLMAVGPTGLIVGFLTAIGL